MGADADAARHVLESPAIQNSMVAAYIVDEGGDFVLGWDEIEADLKGMLSDGETVLVNIAYALYSGQSDPLLEGRYTGPAFAALRWLDADHFRIVLEALAIKRGMTVRVVTSEETT